MPYPGRRVQGFEDCDSRVRRRVCAHSLVMRLKPLKRLPTGARPLFKDAATDTTPAPRSLRLPHDALTPEMFFPSSSLSAGWADQINHANCAAYARTPQSRASRKWGPECLTCRTVACIGSGRCLGRALSSCWKRVHVHMEMQRVCGGWEGLAHGGHRGPQPRLRLKLPP